jgi:hypothetical protein
MVCDLDSLEDRIAGGWNSGMIIPNHRNILSPTTEIFVRVAQPQVHTNPTRYQSRFKVDASLSLIKWGAFCGFFTRENYFIHDMALQSHP